MQNKNFIVGYNRQGQLVYIDLVISAGLLTPPIRIYEDMIFTALFINGVRVYNYATIVEGYTAANLVKFLETFTQQERYLISSEFFDSTLLNPADFRKQNTNFVPQFFKPLVNPMANITSMTATNVLFTYLDDFVPQPMKIYADYGFTPVTQTPEGTSSALNSSTSPFAFVPEWFSGSMMPVYVAIQLRTAASNNSKALGTMSNI